MSNAEKREKIEELLKPYLISLTGSKERQLREALYTLREVSGILHYINDEDAYTIWALIELVKNEGFPEELWM